MTWADPRVDGAGCWEPTPPHTPLGTLGVLVLCAVMVATFAVAVTVGRHAMCRIYEHRPQPPSYCHYTGQAR